MAAKLLSQSLSFLPPISLRRLSTAAILAPNPAEQTPAAHFSVAQYLVHSCGLSNKAADAASPALASLRSPDKPDAVLRFLRDRGLTDDEIAAFVSRRPRLLCTSAGSEFFAKFDFLVGLGFPVSEAAALLQKLNLLRNVSLSFVKKRVEFLRSILEKDADLTKAIKNSAGMLTWSAAIEKNMVDNITKLGEWGVPSKRIKYLIATEPRFFQLKSDVIDNAAAIAEGELGMSRGSKMFVPTVMVLTTNKESESARHSKYEVFESFGWNKSDIVALFRTFPAFIHMGVADLTKKLELLMNKAGCTAAYIAKCGPILGMSLERRIIPRYELLCALKAKKIPSKELTSSFWYVVSLSEENFQRKFVNEFMKVEPDACQAYVSSIK